MNAVEQAIESLHETATAIFRDALEGCSIESAFDRRIRFEGDTLVRLLPEGSGPAAVSLKDYRRIFVIAMGKAAIPMIDVLMARMKRRAGLRGICCSNAIPERRNWRIRYFEGGHPLPNEGSFAAARAALALLRRARKDTLVIFLISGGSSALFDLPLDPDISLEDTMVFHQALIASGAPITEVNTIRKHFSAVKGGRLALASAEAAKLSILLPDVPLRSLDTLASGPTSPDHTTVEQVRTLLAKYDLLAKFPPAIGSFFEREDLPESPGNKSRLPAFLPPLLQSLPWADNHAIAVRKTIAAALKSEQEAFRDSMFEVLLSSHDLVENALARALELGYFTVVDNSCDDWDYEEAARHLLKHFHSIREEHPRCCLISGGEVTVTIDRAPGAGGRNQQFALASAISLAAHPNEALVVFSAGSDGIDGNTRSAGAIADSITVRRAVDYGYDPKEALAGFNACPLFTALGDTVVTGPTGHNLRDLRLLMAEPLPLP